MPCLGCVTFSAHGTLSPLFRENEGVVGVCWEKKSGPVGPSPPPPRGYFPKVVMVFVIFVEESDGNFDKPTSLVDYATFVYLLLVQARFVSITSDASNAHTRVCTRGQGSDSP